VGIGVGVLWLQEELRSGAGPVIGEVFALAALAVGVWLLAHGAPQLEREECARTAEEGVPR
jgi:hypothetical protein